jgi:hypothetical protein
MRTFGCAERAAAVDGRDTADPPPLETATRRYGINMSTASRARMALARPGWMDAVPEEELVRIVALEGGLVWRDACGCYVRHAEGRRLEVDVDERLKCVEARKRDVGER